MASPTAAAVALAREEGEMGVEEDVPPPAGMGNADAEDDVAAEEEVRSCSCLKDGSGCRNMPPADIPCRTGEEVDEDDDSCCSEEDGGGMGRAAAAMAAATAAAELPVVAAMAAARAAVEDVPAAPHPEMRLP